MTWGWAAGAVRTTYEVCATRAEALEVEREAIRNEHPLANVRSPGPLRPLPPRPALERQKMKRQAQLVERKRQKVLSRERTARAKRTWHDKNALRSDLISE